MNEQQMLRTIVATLTLAMGVAFVSHGVLAVTQDPTWVGLFERSLRLGEDAQPLGMTIGELTRVVGLADVAFGILLLLFAILAYHPWTPGRTKALFALLAVATFWQFATAASFVVADGFDGAWHALERTPFWVVPFIGACVCLRLRKHTAVA